MASRLSRLAAASAVCIIQETTDPVLAANERELTRMKTKRLIRVHSRSFAAEDAFVHASESMVALGQMYSRILAVAQDWSGC